MKAHAHVFETVIDRLETFESRVIDFIDCGTHQDDVTDCTATGDTSLNHILKEARVHEVEAFIDPQGHQRWVCRDRVAMDVAKVLAARHKTDLGHMRA